MNETIKIKRKFLSALLRTGAFTTLAMMPLAIHMKFYMVAVFQVFLVLSLLMTDFYIKKKLKNFTLASFASFSLAFITTSVVSFFGDRDIFYWFLLFPPATMFAFGLKNGLKWNILSIAILFFLLFYQHFYRDLTQNSAIIILSSYVALFLISYFLEKARQTIETQLETISLTDFLTSAKNRRGFDQELRQIIEMSKRTHRTFCLVFLDIDNFKQVNDRYGHDVGDEILVAITRVIKENLRTNDEIFRIGGEEFAILLQETDLAGGEFFGKRLRLAICKFKFPSVKKLTVSMGLVQYQPGDNRENLMKRTDKMLYLAKENGRDRIEMEKMSGNTRNMDCALTP